MNQATIRFEVMRWSAGSFSPHLVSIHDTYEAAQADIEARAALFGARALVEDTQHAGRYSIEKRWVVS